MKENVDFKQVANDVRFRMLGPFNFLTPTEFEKLTKAEQNAYYYKCFDLFHDVCRYLGAQLDLDKFMNKYPKK